MIEVFYAKLPTQFPTEQWLAYLGILPEHLRNVNQKYRRWEDRYANLFGKLLLIIGLRKYGFGKEALSQFRYTAHQRPYLSGKIDFNISHSGSYVLCAIGESIRIGIDIEKVKPVDFNDFDMVMNDKQWAEIKMADNPTRKFYDYWTIKESIIKADSRGMAIPLKDLEWGKSEAVYDDKKWHIQPLHIDDTYASHFVTNLEGVSVKLKEIDFYKKGSISFW